MLSTKFVGPRQLGCIFLLLGTNMGSGGTEVSFNGGLPPDAIRVFVGSWATGDGTKFACDRCGSLHSRGVNITVINDDVNICRKCSAIIRGKLDRAEQVRDGFDDIRFAQ